MVSVLLAVVLAGVTSEEPKPMNYAEAYKKSVAEDKPLMVVIGAPWCQACNVLKDSTLDPMALDGELDQVSLAVINRDQDPELVKQLTKGDRAIPQIIVFTKEDDGAWKRRRLKGYQPKQPVRTLIRKALGNL